MSKMFDDLQRNFRDGWSVKDVLRYAQGTDLESVVVIGMNLDGELVVLENTSNAIELIGLIEAGKSVLLKEGLQSANDVYYDETMDDWDLFNRF